MQGCEDTRDMWDRRIQEIQGYKEKWDTKIYWDTCIQEYENTGDTRDTGIHGIGGYRDTRIQRYGICTDDTTDHGYKDTRDFQVTQGYWDIITGYKNTFKVSMVTLMMVEMYTIYWDSAAIWNTCILGCM